MSLPLKLARSLGAADPAAAWTAIMNHVWEICSAPVPERAVTGEITKRDREVGALDLFLTAAGWDLWRSFEKVVNRTSDALDSWWSSQSGGRAVLLLDALSLREVPWLLKGAADRGYKLHSARATGSELPPETTPFANALGFPSRSALENNCAGVAHRLAGARTESVGLPWADTMALLTADPKWVLWHHWPDSRVHEAAVAGQGLEKLTTEAQRELTSDEFWRLVERLSTGRRLVITSDHGYAASGLFGDTPDDQARYLKDLFKSGRSVDDDGTPSGNWVPPVELAIESSHGKRRYAIGRRKWKSQGGYPTLTHGGLSVLEVASPFIEISRK